MRGGEALTALHKEGFSLAITPSEQSREIAQNYAGNTRWTGLAILHFLRF